jgi:hypothetical protein
MLYRRVTQYIVSCNSNELAIPWDPHKIPLEKTKRSLEKIPNLRAKVVHRWVVQTLHPFTW